jgi:hypothetical protein
MFGKMLKKSSLCLAASLVLAAAPASWAGCPSTSTVYDVSGSSSPTNTYYVAVAANFTSTLYNWLSTYYFSSTYNSNYNSTNYATYKIELCSDSTGNLKAAIKAGTLAPILFFSADNTADSTTGVSTYTEYAKGYPILIGYTGGTNGNSATVAKTISSVGDLITGLTGGSQDIPASGSLSSAYTLSSTLTAHTDGTGVLVSDPALAPYGNAAINAINTMENLSLSNDPDSTSIPAWLKPLATYSSVTKAYNAIGISTGAYAGFAAYSLICNNLPSNAYWVRITDPDYLTVQDVGYLSSNDPSTHPGLDMYNLIGTEKSSGVWLSLITANGCYASI